ncbi:unnamed protein product [Pleuronectes platessa]|uniref:Uncharacterized protein n=1 Tax=Pleuronectes platessa TaxID=8262 RepID=A0A9N7UES4_PLEPL|nr:unnamed protein product [Pleuronectes platessa]
MPILTLAECQACSDREGEREGGMMGQTFPWQDPWDPAEGRVQPLKERLRAQQSISGLHLHNKWSSHGFSSAHTRAHTTYECIHSALISTRRRKPPYLPPKNYQLRKPTHHGKLKESQKRALDVNDLCDSSRWGKECQGLRGSVGDRQLKSTPGLHCSVEPLRWLGKGSSFASSKRFTLHQAAAKDRDGQAQNCSSGEQPSGDIQHNSSLRSATAGVSSVNTWDHARRCRRCNSPTQPANGPPCVPPSQLGFFRGNTASYHPQKSAAFYRSNSPHYAPNPKQLPTKRRGKKSAIPQFALQHLLEELAAESEGDAAREKKKSPPRHKLRLRSRRQREKRNAVNLNV